MPLTMNRKEVHDYFVKNSYAGMMLFVAGDDYIASRCCILNGLTPGWILASEAIEKILKAVIFLESGKKTALRSDDRHNPFLLKEELKKISNNYGELDFFDAELKKLFGHFNTRYYDGPFEKRSNGKDGRELGIIDQLWVFLIEKLPMPDEAKYRTKFFADLCEKNKYNPQTQYWAVINNVALEKKISLIINRYREVLNDPCYVR